MAEPKRHMDVLERVLERKALSAQSRSSQARVEKNDQA